MSLDLQGYLAHGTTPTPLGPPEVPRHRTTVGSYGGGVSYERGTHVSLQLRFNPGGFRSMIISRLSMAGIDEEKEAVDVSVDLATLHSSSSECFDW